MLGPRIGNGGRPCPVTHLEGIIAAARKVHDWAAGLIAQFEHTVTQTQASTPADISAHIALLQTRLTQVESQLRFGADFAGQVTQGDAPPDIHMRADNYLWDALQLCFVPNQAIPMPELLDPAQGRTAADRQERATEPYSNVSITVDDPWRVAATSARS